MKLMQALGIYLAKCAAYGMCAVIMLGCAAAAVWLLVNTVEAMNGNLFVSLVCLGSILVVGSWIKEIVE